VDSIKLAHRVRSLLRFPVPPSFLILTGEKTRVLLSGLLQVYISNSFLICRGVELC